MDARSPGGAGCSSCRPHPGLTRARAAPGSADQAALARNSADQAGLARNSADQAVHLLAVLSGVAIVGNWVLLFASYSRASIAIGTAVYNVQPFMLVGGVITAGLGIFTLAKPQVVTSFLPIVFGIFIVVDGLSRIGTAIDLAKRKGQKWWLLLLFSIVSVALGVLLVLHPFDAAVSAVMLCGILLIAEGALNLGCILYAAMELRTLDRMASAAANAALGAIGDALDEAEAAERDVGSDGPVVYDAESKDVSEDGE